MEAVALKFPETIDEDELIWMPATWDEYLDLAQTAPYTVQYLNGEIIMSQASDIHEELVARLIWLFTNVFIDQPEYRILGSNIKVVIPGEKGDFNADMSVIHGPSDFGLTPSGRPSSVRIKNPEIVVEVLSKSTRSFDMTEKLAYYKLIPSLKYVLFVDQLRPFASVYTRTETPDEWLNRDYRTLESVVQLGDVQLPMQDIYRKMTF